MMLLSWTAGGQTFHPSVTTLSRVTLGRVPCPTLYQVVNLPAF